MQKTTSLNHPKKLPITWNNQNWKDLSCKAQSQANKILWIFYQSRTVTRPKKLINSGAKTQVETTIQKRQSDQPGADPNRHAY